MAFSTSFMCSLSFFLQTQKQKWILGCARRGGGELHRVFEFEMFCLLMATVSQLRWWYDFFCWSLCTSLNISQRFRISVFTLRNKKGKNKWRASRLLLKTLMLEHPSVLCVFCTWRLVTNSLSYSGFLPEFQCNWTWLTVCDDTSDRKNSQCPWFLSWDCGSKKALFFLPSSMESYFWKLGQSQKT